MCSEAHWLSLSHVDDVDCAMVELAFEAAELVTFAASVKPSLTESAVDMLELVSKVPGVVHTITQHTAEGNVV